MRDAGASNSCAHHENRQSAKWTDMDKEELSISRVGHRLIFQGVHDNFIFRMIDKAGGAR